MEYSDIIKELRESNNLKQKSVAEFLGISRGLYAQYEIADKVIPVNHLNNLSNYFKTSIDYLLGLNKKRFYSKTRSDINNELFKLRLKELRTEKKISQEQLAHTLNTTHSVISAYENGKTIILTSFLYQICKEYKISADYLLGRIDEPKYLQ